MDTIKQIMRQDYMEHRATHEEYYSQIAHEAGISFKGSSMLPRICKALEKGDEHLNSIPLQIWDNLAYAYINRATINRVFKAHGDFWSLAGHVCALKQAAREAAQAKP